MNRIFVVFLTLVTAASSGPASAAPSPSSFVATGVDKAAIGALLATYTKAVSTKNQQLFETLLLSKTIPFSSVSDAVGGPGDDHTRNYEAFRKGGFEGAAFTQRFRDIHIQQDGAFATVSLVFINTSAASSDWGWKSMQLLRIDGRWRIASEFYTGHALP